MEIQALLAYGNILLRHANTETPLLDAEVLLAHIVQKERSWILTNGNHSLSTAQEKKYRALLVRRMHHEPVAYITGQKWFYGHQFFVNRQVLIPRPETELLIDMAISVIQKQKKVFLIDVGTGSGCIPISILKTTKKIQAIAIDTSRQALRVAQKNAKIHGVSKRIFFIQGNLLQPLSTKKIPKNIPMVITANLPYLTPKQWKATQPDVQTFEPKGALVGGTYGLGYYRQLLTQLRRWKIKNPDQPVTTIFEIDPSQRQSIQKLIASIFPKTKPVFYKDLSSKTRVVYFSL